MLLHEFIGIHGQPVIICEQVQIVYRQSGRPTIDAYNKLMGRYFYDAFTSLNVVKWPHFKILVISPRNSTHLSVFVHCTKEESLDTVSVQSIKVLLYFLNCK